MRTIKKWLACICVYVSAFVVAACSLPIPNGGNPGSSTDGESSPNSSSSELLSGSLDSESIESSTQEESSVEEIEIPDTSPLIVSESTYTDFVVCDSETQATFMRSEELDIWGDYDGNAVKMAYETGKKYAFVNPFTDEQLQTLQDDYGYTHVSLWFAVSGVRSQITLIKETKSPYNILQSTGLAEYALAPMDNLTWYNQRVPISAYKKTLFTGENDTQYAYITQAETETDGETYLYFGDVELITDPSILTVNEFTAKDVSNKDVASEYVSAEDETLMQFTGGYVGNAKKFKAASNANWKIKNPYSAKQLQALKKKYSKVTLWFAFDNLSQEGTIHLENWSIPAPTFSQYAKGAKSFTSTDNGVWQSLSISVDDFITICTTQDKLTAVADFYLFRVVNRSTAADGTFMYLYIGDVYFEE